MVGTDSPSGPLTDTFGTSGLTASEVVAAAGCWVGADFLAPGGTYAFCPRTTAPYLRTRCRGDSLIRQKDNLLLLFTDFSIINNTTLLCDMRVVYGALEAKVGRDGKCNVNKDARQEFQRRCAAPSSRAP